MKEIKAIIQPFMVEKVLDALSEIGDLPGLTISQVQGWGRSRAVNASDKVEESGHMLAKKTKIEIVVRDQDVQALVDTIARAARTGNVGDGKVFVIEVADVVRIRTGERGEVGI